jgi:hypothetical protein
VRAYFVEHLGDPQAVLVVDETGDAPGGAEERGVRAPPPVIAVTG